MKKRKTSKRRSRRFGDSVDIEMEDIEESKTLPGLTGDEKTRKRLTTRLCTQVMQGKDADLPAGQSKARVRDWCTVNMKGNPFPVTLSPALKKTCAGMSVKKCLKTVRESAGPEAAGVGIKLDKVVSKGATLVTKTVKGRDLVPSVKGSAVCKPAKGHSLRDCHYELRFFNAEQAREKKLPGAGPYLRVCTGEQKPGALYKVDSPEEAKALLDKHCACRKGGGDHSTCEKAGPKPAGFGLYGYKVRR